VKGAVVVVSVRRVRHCNDRYGEKKMDEVKKKMDEVEKRHLWEERRG